MFDDVIRFPLSTRKQLTVGATKTLFPSIHSCTLSSDPCQTSLTCLLREGYRSAAGFLAHVKEVKDDLEAIIKQVGKERVKVSRVANSLQISVQIQTSRRFI